MLTLLLGIGLMAYAGAQLIQTERIYQEGNAAYEDLSAQVKASAASGYQTPNASTEESTVEGARVYIPDLGIDFETLKTINKDAVAWLYCPDTVIDYPVMKADDYSYYLDRLPDGTKNANGSLFIDFNCASDFSDSLTVVYGHNMKSGRMFGSLTGYKDQGYFDEHPFLYLYTEKENYRIDLLYGCVIGAGQWRERAFMYPQNVEALLAYAVHNTTFTSSVEYQEGDRIIALSTCSYEFDDARYVVIGILRGEH